MTGASGFAQDVLKQNRLFSVCSEDAGLGSGSCAFGRGSGLCPGKGYGDCTRSSESVSPADALHDQAGCSSGRGKADGTGRSYNFPRLSWYIIRR